MNQLAEEINKSSASGVKFEIIGIDNKLSPQETTAALRSAMDQGVRYVFQGNGSGPALAIMDALEKHNARNKGKEVVYIKSAMKLGKEDGGKIALMPDGKVEGKMAKGPAPKEIAFVPAIPKNRAGKIMRRILRKIAENDVGNLGDTTTLADPSVVDDLVKNRAGK